jgi:ABC-type amino acid transport system permease subunit
LNGDRPGRPVSRRATIGAADPALLRIGVRLTPTAVCVAFFCNTSSYYGEIYRAGIKSVGEGQWLAARCTGLSAPATLAWVTLPQAARNVRPILVSKTIEVVKLASIASVVSLPELLYSADMARAPTFFQSRRPCGCPLCRRTLAPRPVGQ